MTNLLKIGDKVRLVHSDDSAVRLKSTFLISEGYVNKPVEITKILGSGLYSVTLPSGYELEIFPSDIVGWVNPNLK